MCQLVTFGKVSNDVATTGTGSMHVVASRVAIPYGYPGLFQNAIWNQEIEIKHLEVSNLPNTIWTLASYTEKHSVLGQKLRTTSSLLRVKSPGKAWTSEENINPIREAIQRGPLK
jgi:hypothetical protein